MTQNDDTRLTAARLRTAGLMLFCILCAALAAGGLARAGNATLEDRVRDLEAEREIRDLLVSYGQALDTLDFKLYSSLFARSGSWNGRATEFRTIQGPEVIRSEMERIFADTPKDPEHKTMVHLMTNMKIEIDGDRASGYSKYTVFFRNEQDKPYLDIVGHYDDTFIREDGRWKFLSRRARWDMP